MFKSQVKGLLEYLGVILLLVLVFDFVVASETSGYSYHYKGQSYVTANEYAELASDTKVDGVTQSTLIQTKLGLQFTYNFYAKTHYSFLQSVPIGSSYIDNAYIQSLRTANWEGVWVVLVLGLALLYWVSVNQRKTINATKKFKRLLLKWQYSAVKLLSGPTNVVANIKDLTVAYSGVIGVRSWRYSNGKLRSLVQNVDWKQSSVVADAIPDKVNFAGLHAYRLGAPTTQVGDIMGLVEMRGKYEHHPDGVVRAENCQVLALFISNVSPKFAAYLSVKYKVPVYMAEDARQGYMSWMFTSAGLNAMKHNQELLGE
jgi:hypothetical protein